MGVWWELRAVEHWVALRGSLGGFGRRMGSLGAFEGTYAGSVSEGTWGVSVGSMGFMRSFLGGFYGILRGP